MGLIWGILMLLFVVGNMLLISTPFFLIEWFEKKFSNWIVVPVSSIIYLLFFSFGIYLMTLVGPKINATNELRYIAFMMIIFFIIQLAPLAVGYILKPKKTM